MHLKKVLTNPREVVTERIAEKKFQKTNLVAAQLNGAMHHCLNSGSNSGFCRTFLKM